MSLLGLAQFALGAGDTYNKEKERLDVKAYDRGRQKVIDDRADKAEQRTQEAWDIEKPEAELKLEATKRLATSAKDADLYTKVNNQVLHLESLGDSLGAVDTIVTGTNSHSAVPFKMDVVRNEAGKAVAFQDDDGGTYYKTNLYDKETGELISETDMTMDELKNSYTQLQDGTARAAAAAEIQRKRQEKLDDAEIEVASFKDKEAVKQGYTVANKQLDHQFKLGQMGVQYDLDVGKLNIGQQHAIEKLGIGQQHAIEKLGIGQQYALDRIGAQATNAQVLAQLNTDLRSGLIDQQAYNAIQKDLANAAINQGQVPNVNNGSASNKTKVAPKAGNAANIATQKALPKSSGYCARYVRQALQASGYKFQQPRYAREYNNGIMNKIGFSTIASNTKPQKGDVMVMPAQGGHSSGHIQIYNGSQWVSDFVQPNKNPWRNVPNDKLQFKLYRDMSGGPANSKGVNVSLNAKLQPKPTAASKTAAGQTKPVTVNDFNANVDKGFKAAVSSGASYGIKKDAASTVQFTQAAAIVKAFPKAKSQAEFSSLYSSAVNTVIKAIPASKLKKLSNDQKKSIGNALVLQMAGASSASDLKTTVYNLNPSLRAGNTSNLAKVANKPAAKPSKTTTRFQAAKDKNASQQVTAANAPATKPASTTTRNLNNANSAIDWN